MESHRSMFQRPFLLASMAALALVISACSGSGHRVRALTARVPQSDDTASARRLNAQLVSPPQQPAEGPLLDATQPDLPPQAAPLAPVPVETSGDVAASFSQPRTVNLPPGFRASVYAVTGGSIRFMAYSPDGYLFATLMDKGQVVRPVEDGGSVLAHASVVVDGLNQPHGIAFSGGYLYIGETNQIVRFPYSNGQVQPAAKEVVVPNLPTGGHSTRTVEFGPDGLMYVAVGSSCNVCIEQDPLRAAITVFNPDGSGRRTYAAGLRNAVGVTWNPATGDAWATMNGRDQVGADMGLTGAEATEATDNLPPDYVTRLTDGGNYGWPRCYGDHQLDPRFGDAGFCQGTLAPSVLIQAHSAPLGLGFYTGSSFPAGYQGDLFVALHGSWNRSTPTGYKVVRVKFQDGSPVGVEDFVTGWLAGGRAWGRPVDVLTSPDGSLLISDDMAGAIYRISYAGS